MSRLKILFCTNGIFPSKVGGMQKHSRLLIETLAARGNVDLVVVHPHHNQTLFPDNQRIREYAIAPPKRKLQYIISQYLYSMEVYEVIRQHPNAIIYSQGISVWYKMEDVMDRLIVNPHGLEAYQSLTTRDRIIGLPFRLIFNKLLRKANKVISLGGKLTDILQKKVSNPANNLIVIPNATTPVFSKSVGREVRSSENPISILFVGRFAYNKGIKYLLDAISELSKSQEFQRFEFCLVGKGPLFNQYSQNNPWPNVSFPGFIDDDKFEDLFSRADIFVLPTLFEGMPTVILEAMARKLPIMTTDVGATRELVDETNGFIIPRKDPSAIVRTLQKFAQLPLADRLELGENSHIKFHDRFTWEKVAIQHENLFFAMSKEKILAS